MPARGDWKLSNSSITDNTCRICKRYDAIDTERKTGERCFRRVDALVIAHDWIQSAAIFFSRLIEICGQRTEKCFGPRARIFADFRVNYENYLSAKVSVFFFLQKKELSLHSFHSLSNAAAYETLVSEMIILIFMYGFFFSAL